MPDSRRVLSRSAVTPLIQPSSIELRKMRIAISALRLCSGVAPDAFDIRAQSEARDEDAAEAALPQIAAKPGRGGAVVLEKRRIAIDGRMIPFPYDQLALGILESWE